MQWTFILCLFGLLPQALAADRENLVLGLIDEPAGKVEPAPDALSHIHTTLQAQQQQLSQQQQLLEAILKQQQGKDEQQQHQVQLKQQIEQHTAMLQQLQTQLKQQKMATSKAKQVASNPVLVEKPRWQVAGQRQNSYWLRNAQNQYLQVQPGDLVAGYGYLRGIDAQGIAIFDKP